MDKMEEKYGKPDYEAYPMLGYSYSMLAEIAYEKVWEYVSKHPVSPELDALALMYQLEKSALTALCGVVTVKYASKKKVRKYKSYAPDGPGKLSKLREEAICMLGGYCVRCQCDDIRCLEIDHVLPIRGVKREQAYTLYQSILRGSTDNLQVLCANCHAIKTYHADSF